VSSLCKYLILFICFVSLASAFTARVDSYNQSEIETELVSVEVEAQVSEVVHLPQLFFISSFPHHINLLPQIEILEFIKPPSA
jgi:hypothetical protein